MAFATWSVALIAWLTGWLMATSPCVCGSLSHSRPHTFSTPTVIFIGGVAGLFGGTLLAQLLVLAFRHSLILKDDEALGAAFITTAPAASIFWCFRRCRDQTSKAGPRESGILRLAALEFESSLRRCVRFFLSRLGTDRRTDTKTPSQRRLMSPPDHRRV